MFLLHVWVYLVSREGSGASRTAIMDGWKITMWVLGIGSQSSAIIYALNHWATSPAPRFSSYSWLGLRIKPTVLRIPDNCFHTESHNQPKVVCYWYHRHCEITWQLFTFTMWTAAQMYLDRLKANLCPMMLTFPANMRIERNKMSTVLEICGGVEQTLKGFLERRTECFNGCIITSSV